MENEKPTKGSISLDLGSPCEAEIINPLTGPMDGQMGEEGEGRREERREGRGERAGEGEVHERGTESG